MVFVIDIDVADAKLEDTEEPYDIETGGRVAFMALEIVALEFTAIGEEEMIDASARVVLGMLDVGALETRAVDVGKAAEVRVNEVVGSLEVNALGLSCLDVRGTVGGEVVNTEESDVGGDGLDSETAWVEGLLMALVARSRLDAALDASASRIPGQIATITCQLLEC